MRIPSGDATNMCSMNGLAPIRRSDALPADYPQFLAEVVQEPRSADRADRADGLRLMSVSIVVTGE